jgi:5-methyltetrahydropteroyltriglutamate--homocysteine methyltransferase
VDDLKTHLTGFFPRSEELVRVTRAFERHKLSRGEVEEAAQKDVIHLLGLQRDNSLDYAVDGQLNWQDHFRPFSHIFSGITPGGLTRWYDNNAFYRQPIITEKVRYLGTGLEEYFRYGPISADVAKKAILPGPYTFAHSSQRPAYKSLADLASDLAHAIRDTCRRLAEEGYTYFQFDEPTLTFHVPNKDELTIAKNAYEILENISNARTCLQTYFGDAAPILDSLLDFKTTSIGIDFYSTSLKAILDCKFDKELGCGCVDGRNSLLEDPTDLVNLIHEAENITDDIFICPNCDLEFLPYMVARKKVQLLSETKKRMN